jgi:hypothetical protein
LGTWQNAPNFDVDAQLSAVLLKGHHSEVQLIRRSTDRRVVFSRITLLYLIKQACIACSEDGLLVQNEDHQGDVGLSCLMTNDLLLPFVPSPSDDTLKRLANLLPFADYIGHDQYSMDIGRTLIMFDEISCLPVLKARTDFIDIKGIFEHYMGLSIRTFCELIFGCATKFLSVNLDQIRASTEALFLRSAFFRKTKLEPATVVQFLKKLAIPENVLARKINESHDRPGDDLTVFQQNPLIEIGPDLYICVDPGFLGDKAGRAAFWTLFSEISQNSLRLELLSFWGAVFEEYVNYALVQSYSAGGHLLLSPRFANGDQAFDACLIEGRDLIVFEHKSSTLRADAKYGGDTKKLREQLHLKFVDGDEEGKKGVAQLSSSLERFLAGENLDGISNNQISKVYSVLVCLDNSVIVPLMGQYFNDQFRTLFPRKKFKRTTITPIFTLGISDLENLLGYVDTFHFSEILESYYRKNRAMLTSISRSEVPLLANVQAGKNVVRERFSQFGNDIVKKLFDDVEPSI